MSSRNVVCAAHAVSPSLTHAAVDGRPMMALLPGQTYVDDRPWERDWTCLYATTDRFTPNVIDGTVELHAGDRVVFGGFRATTSPLDPVEHMSRSPEILLGHVFTPETSVDSVSVVEIEVPWGDYHGFSGGPVAVVDKSGELRVWGVVVGGKLRWDRSQFLRLRLVMVAARLPQVVLDRIQKAKFLNPTELPRSNATSAPTVPKQE